MKKPNIMDIEIEMDLAGLAISKSGEIIQNRNYRRENMKIYLSGPMSNNKNYKKDFENARGLILRYGIPESNIEIHSPIDLHLEGEDWEYCMKETLKLMLSCECIVLLPAIRDYVSKGTVIEQLVASTVGMNIWTLKDFINTFAPLPF
jgi:nucleoside 2-deoxyribosyltransferase